MFCKSCGKKIDADSVFCSHCGVKQTETKIRPVSNEGKAENSESDFTLFFKKLLSELHPGLVKSAKIILFVFLGFILTGLLISLTHFGQVPALWTIPIFLILLYQFIFRSSGKKVDIKEDRAIDSIIGGQIVLKEDGKKMGETGLVQRPENYFKIESEKNEFDLGWGAYKKYTIRYNTGRVGYVYKGKMTKRYFWSNDEQKINYTNRLEDAVLSLYLFIHNKNNR